MEKDCITGRGRQKDCARARDLVCYWTVVECGMSMVDLARKFGMTPAAVSYALERGEKMAKERGYRLQVDLFEYLRSSLFLAKHFCCRKLYRNYLLTGWQY